LPKLCCLSYAAFALSDFAISILDLELRNLSAKKSEIILIDYLAFFMPAYSALQE